MIDELNDERLTVLLNSECSGSPNQEYLQAFQSGSNKDLDQLIIVICNDGSAFSIDDQVFWYTSFVPLACAARDRDSIPSENPN